MKDDQDPGAASATARLALAACGGVLAVALLPGLLAALAGACALRRWRLKWSWTLPTAAFSVPIAAALTPAALRGAGPLWDAALTGKFPIGAGLVVLAPAWLVTAPVACALGVLWQAHRDRLRGGRAEAAAADVLGPIEYVRLRREQRIARRAGPDTDRGVLLGADPRGRPVWLPRLRAHAILVGGSNTGKTNTAEVLIEGHVASGSALVVLDGKGGQDLPRVAVQLGARYQRPVALWSIAPYGDEHLDELRLSWNATGDGNPTEIKDRVASTEEQTEPYFKAIASYGLLAACQALTHTDGHVRLDRLAAVMSNRNAFKALLRAADPERFQQPLTWLEALTDTERSGLTGMGLRETMIASDGGAQLLPADGQEIVLCRAIREGWLVVFTLAEGTYPDLIPHVARYVLQALNAVCTRIETQDDKADAVIFVDELSAFDGDQLASGFERGRSAGVRYLVATQSLSNFISAGGDKLMDAALDNSELIVIHRQSVPEAAERLAGVAGTEEAWEHTHKVSDAPGIGTAVGSRLGLDEPGERARRLTDRFRVHPNAIKQLAQGHAYVIQHRPQHAVGKVHIRGGLTADLKRARADQPLPGVGEVGA